MLDQTDYIARYDKSDALGVIARQPEQLRRDYEVKLGAEFDDVRQIVVAGMGGSALAAELLKSWLSDKLPVPLVIVRDYALPAFVGPETLVVVSSYSGNTEESLSALTHAEELNAKVVVMASGGKLLDEARANGRKHRPLLPEGHPHFDLPAGIQPRMAVWYGVRALAEMLEEIGIVQNVTPELEATADWLADEVKAWTAEVPTVDNAAKQIANELVGHPVVVYGGPLLATTAMKWKIDFNENAKHLAFYNYLPEFNHNEFQGWAHPEQHGMKVIELRSDLDHSQVQKRFDVTNRLLSDRFAPIEVQAKGKTKLEQMLWVQLLGDFVSVYLAFLNGIDPTPVDMVEKFKKELA